MGDAPSHLANHCGRAKGFELMVRLVNGLLTFLNGTAIVEDVDFFGADLITNAHRGDLDRRFGTTNR